MTTRTEQEWIALANEPLAEIHSIGVARYGTTVTATCGDPVEVSLLSIDYRTGREDMAAHTLSARIQNRRAIEWAGERPCFEHDPAQQRELARILEDVRRYGSE